MFFSYLWKTFKFTLSIVLIILFFKTFLFETGRVNGVSMVPTFKDSDIFFINKYALLFSPPTRLQVIQCRNPLKTSVLLIKRVVGLPGETVHIHSNIVSVTTTDKQTIILDEPYLPAGAITQMWNEEPGDIVLGRDEYYVLGDNRRESGDSRHFGPILRKDILGAVL